MISERDRLSLAYLAASSFPLWGGHIQRGEPISDPNMQRWLDLGLIEPVEKRGYRLTDKGHAALARPMSKKD